MKTRITTLFKKKYLLCQSSRLFIVFALFVKCFSNGFIMKHTYPIPSKINTSRVLPFWCSLPIGICPLSLWVNHYQKTFAIPIAIMFWQNVHNSPALYKANDFNLCLLNCVKLKDSQALNARFCLRKPLCSYPLNYSLVQQCSDTLMPGLPGLSTPETFTCQSFTYPL